MSSEPRVCPDCGDQLRRILKPDHAPQRWMCGQCGYVSDPAADQPCTTADELQARYNLLGSLGGPDIDAAKQLASDAIATIRQLEAKLKRLQDALISIEEYWNGGINSAVDAAEEMRERARAALNDTQPEGRGP